MDNHETSVTEQVTENAAATAEEAPKVYTEQQFQDKLNEVMGKRMPRMENRIRREYERKYADAEAVLKAGTGKQTVEEATDHLKEVYAAKNIPIAYAPDISDKDMQVLAKADADEIIDGGYEEVVAEVERLTKLGKDGMSPREKLIFQTLAAHRNSTERARELEALGVSEEVYDSQEFKDFSKEFAAGTPMKKIYGYYQQMHPTKEVQTMGSMKNTDHGENGVKDFYTPEEASKFKKADYDKNPALYKAVLDSMTKWR